MLTFNTLICKLGLHDWDETKFRPCERFKVCLRCSIEKVYPGYHRFPEWGKTHYVKVYYGDEYVGTESK